MYDHVCLGNMLPCINAAFVSFAYIAIEQSELVSLDKRSVEQNANSRHFTCAFGPPSKVALFIRLLSAPELRLESTKGSHLNKVVYV